MSESVDKFKKNPLASRINEINRIKIAHPDRCAIFIGKLNSDTLLPDITKHKYLVPYDFTMAQFMSTIRRYIKVSAETAIFLFINNMVTTNHSSIGKLYEEYKSEDGFLYITYAGENTFG